MASEETSHSISDETPTEASLKVQERGSSIELLQLQEMPFTDRTLEIQKLKSALDQVARTGHGAFIFISGEAGIGKTRLTEEARKFAASYGFQWFSSKCSKGDDLAPYSPWIEILREFSRRASVQEFYRVCGPHVNEIVRLIPELTPTASNEISSLEAPSISDLTRAESTQKRKLFFQALTQFFRRLSRESALALVLDDLQWADPSTIQLLRYFLGAELKDCPILVISAYRNQELKSGENPTVSDFLNEVEVERKFTTIQLNRLNTSAVGELLASLAGLQQISDEFRDFIHSRTGGNPFFVQEVLRALIEKGDVYRDVSGQWHRKSISEIEIPSSVKALIQKRLDRLAEGRRDILRIASILGDTFDFKVLAKTCSLICFNEAEIKKAVNDALKEHLLYEYRETEMSKALWFTFADESIREVLQSELDPSRRKLVNLSVATAFEALYSTSSRNEISSQLAHHFLEAGEEEKGFDYCLIAAERSASLFAHQESIKHYKVALELLNNRHGGLKSQKAKILEELGEETWSAGDFECLDYWMASAKAYEEIDEKRIAGNLYRKMAFVYQTLIVDRDNSLDCYTRAIKLLSSEPSSAEELAHTYVALSIPYYWDGQLEKSRGFLEKGLSLARSIGNKRVEFIALDGRVEIGSIERKEEVLDQCNMAIEFLSQRDYARDAGHAYYHKALWYSSVKGASNETLEVLSEASSYARKVGHYTTIVALNQMSIFAHLTLGNIQSAKKIALETSELSRRSHKIRLVRIHDLRARGQLLFLEGDYDQAEEAFKEAIDLTHRYGLTFSFLRPYIGLSTLYMRKGEYERTEDILKQAYEISKKRDLTISNAMKHVEILSLLIELGILSKKSLQETEANFVELSNAAAVIDEEWAQGYCLRAKGMLDSNQERLEEAIGNLSQCVKIWERLSWPYELGRTLYELALVYQKNGEIHESSAAASRALEVFSKLGARIEIESCNFLIETLLLFEKMPKFSNPSSKKVLNYLSTCFYNDFTLYNMNPDSAGWRTIQNVAKSLNIASTKLYNDAAMQKGPLSEVLRSGLIQLKIFKGERGRGGEITRFRVCYDKPLVKEYVNAMVKMRTDKLR